MAINFKRFFKRLDDINNLNNMPNLRLMNPWSINVNTANMAMNMNGNTNLNLQSDADQNANPNSNTLPMLMTACNPPLIINPQSFVNN